MARDMALPATRPSDAALLAQAARRAGQGLGLTVARTARVLGVGRSTLYRGLDPGSKAGELAGLLIRAWRSLQALTGDEAAARHWMRTWNRELGGVPLALLDSVEGLARVVEYLDAMRAKL